jgi:aryl sulfotransferase
VLHHAETCWDRRHHPQVYLFHYSDLLRDLLGQFRRLAEALSIDATDGRIGQFAEAATFDRMKEQAGNLVPDARSQIFRSNQDFFARGHDGQWRELFDDQDLFRYQNRVAQLVPPDTAAWAHAGWLSG